MFTPHDFVKKSGGFSTKVLIERIRVQLRKKNNVVEDTKNIINHGKLKLDPSQLECEWGWQTAARQAHNNRVSNSQRTCKTTGSNKRKEPI